VRLIACDLDGTLVRPDGTISARSLTALDACLEAGVGVVFVTGRPPRWMAPIAEATGHRGVAVCGNGAVVIDLATQRVLRARPVAGERVLRVARLLRAALPAATFALETLAGYRREPEFLPHHEAAERALAGPLTDLVADDPVVLKVLCRDETRRADGLLAVARKVLADLAEPVHSNPESSLLEISAPGVTKASALAEFAAERGIAAADVVAFGDMPNDVPMLRWAGRGYAMADGHPEAHAAADARAPACADDGVARVLESLLGRPTPPSGSRRDTPVPSGERTFPTSG
jgi:hypothetical protein